MKQIYSALISVAFLLLISCSSHNETIEVNFDGIEEIIIDAKKGEFLSIDGLVKNATFIKLETTDESLIGSISQLFIIDSLLYVVDSEHTKSIKVFDLQGNYIRKIFAVGNGPGEYVEISNVCLTPDKTQLAILDRPQDKTVYYGLEGKYISQKRNPFMFSYYEFLDNGYVAYDTYSLFDPKLGKYKNNSLIVTDSENNTAYGFFDNLYSDKFGFTKNRTLRKFENSVYYSPNVTNVIFEICDTSVIAKYRINITENGMPEIGDDITNEKFNDLLNSHLFFNGDFVELKDFTYINIMSPNGYPSAVYSHRTKKTYLSDATGSNPLFSFLKGEAPLAAIGDNAVVIAAHAYKVWLLKDDFYKHFASKYKFELDSLYDGLTEDSNPVLFIYHINPEI